MKTFFIGCLFLVVLITPKQIYSQDWESCNSGSKKELLYTTYFTTCDQSIISGTLKGLYRSTDNSNSWTKINNGMTDTSITCFCKKDSDLFVGTEKGGVFKSTDNGVTWVEKNAGITFKNTRRIVSINQNLYLGTYGGGVFMSIDNGDNWTDIGSRLIGEQKKIYSMLVIENKLFVGTYTEGVLVTSDNGLNWKKLNKGLDNLWISSLVIYDNTLYCSTINEFDASNGGIFKSTDFGENWSLLKYDKIREQIYCLKEVDGILMAGTMFGRVYCSKDKGQNWYPLNSKLFPGSNYSISNFTYNDEYVFVSVINKGIFRLKRASISVEDEIYQSDLSIFPNPAGDYITINLGAGNPMLKAVSNDITIYNTLGERVLSTSPKEGNIRIDIAA